MALVRRRFLYSTLDFQVSAHVATIEVGKSVAVLLYC